MRAIARHVAAAAALVLAALIVAPLLLVLALGRARFAAGDP